jgi:8-oxo-dGTP diphosphatase
MLRRLHQTVLRAYGRLPRRVRRVIVRAIAPSWSVGAMCVVEGDDGQVLLVRQSYRKNWGAPGGLLRKHEEPAIGAKRETMEEVGVEVELTHEPHVMIDARARRIDVVYRSRIVPPVPGEIRPGSAEIVEVRWFPLTDLPTLQKELREALAELGLQRGQRPQAGRRGGVA